MGKQAHQVQTRAEHLIFQGLSVFIALSALCLVAMGVYLSHNLDI